MRSQQEDSTPSGDGDFSDMDSLFGGPVSPAEDSHDNDPQHGAEDGAEHDGEHNADAGTHISMLQSELWALWGQDQASYELLTPNAAIYDLPVVSHPISQLSMPSVEDEHYNSWFLPDMVEKTIPQASHPSTGRQSTLPQDPVLGFLSPSLVDHQLLSPNPNPDGTAPLATNRFEVNSAKTQGEHPTESAVSTPTPKHPDTPVPGPVLGESAQLAALPQAQDVNKAGPTLRPNEIPYNRYGGAATQRDMIIPRRIDLDAANIAQLIPFVFFPTRAKLPDLFHLLEISEEEGKDFSKEISNFLRSSAMGIALKEKKSRAALEQSKLALLEASFHVLMYQGRGNFLFGPACATRRTREHFWPYDSTLLTIKVANLIHRKNQIEKQSARDGRNRALKAQLERQKETSNSESPPS